MLEGEPVPVDPPEGLHANNDTVWLVQRCLTGPRDVSRAAARTRLHITAGTPGSGAASTPFVNHRRIVFNPMSVDDLVIVASSSQLNDVVS